LDDLMAEGVDVTRRRDASATMIALNKKGKQLSEIIGNGSTQTA
jgi:hypothetical protein